MRSDLFPYRPRTHQKEIMEDILRNAGSRIPLIMQSKTGSGKTVCALSALLKLCFEEGKRLIYTTRTNSQQQQVVLELRKIQGLLREKGHYREECRDRPLLALPLQGRDNMCLLKDELEDFREAVPEEMSLMCGIRKKRTTELWEEGSKRDNGGVVRGGTVEEGKDRTGEDLDDHGGGKEGGRGKTRKHADIVADRRCPYYLELLEKDLEGLIEWMEDAIPSAQMLSKRCQGMGVCPYELTKRLLDRPRVVVMPYVFVFNDAIRRHLLSWVNEELEDLLLVVDEAHNLPDVLRDMYSFALSQRTISSAKEEAGSFGVESFRGDISVERFLNVLVKRMDQLAEEFLVVEQPSAPSVTGGSEETPSLENPAKTTIRKEDALIPQDALRVGLMSDLGVTSTALKKGVERLILEGMAIKEKKKNDGKLPRSYLLIVASFLHEWNELGEEHFIKLIYDPETPHLEGYSLDCAKGGVISHLFHSSVHMSGTLEPLREYRDSLGLKNCELRSYPSPFEKENLINLYHPTLTTRYAEFHGNEEMRNAYSDEIVSLLSAYPANTLVCFPSYRIMDQFLNEPLLLGVFDERELYVERSHATQQELADQISSFKERTDAVLFSVIGGRITEGMDFPGSALVMVVVVGLPFPKPTARQKALRRYYDIRTGDGWLFAVTAPTVRRTLQAMGRLIRSEKDRGVSVILDRRARRFKEYLGGIETAAISDRVSRFFEEVS